MQKTVPFILGLWIFSLPAFGQFVQLGAQLDGNAPNDNFGWSVALDHEGRTLAVGAPLFDNDFGQVRVYKEASGVWTQIGQDIDGVEIGNQYGFSLSLNGNGKRLAVGGINGTPSTRGGQVRVYQLSNGQWVLMGNPVLAEAEGDQFGYSVDMNAAGDRLVVGGRTNNAGGVNRGHVRVYEWSNNDWVQVGADIDGENDGDLFGISVSISADGHTIVAGASNNSNAGYQAGYVRVFEWSNNNWIQKGGNIEGQNADEYLGLSVSLSSDGQRFITAASNHNHGSGTGSVRVYEFQNGSWVQMGTDIRKNFINEAFGNTVAISPNGLRIAVGTQSADEIGISSGRTNLYEWDNGQWTELLPAIFGAAQFDNLGKSLSFNEDGNRIAIGANLAGSTAGYTVVYQDSIMPVSIGSVYSGPQVSIFADPAEPLFYVQMETLMPHARIEVYDFSGKLSFSQKLGDTERQSLKHNLAPGFYLVVFKSPAGSFAKKILVNRKM